MKFTKKSQIDNLKNLIQSMFEGSGLNLELEVRCLN
jgi:hypothetical protein